MSHLVPRVSVAVLAITALALSRAGSDATENSRSAASASPASRPAPLGGGHNTLDREIRKRLQVRYLLHLPAEYDPAGSRRWPLIVFLHGAGERGNDLDKIAGFGPIRYAREHADFPFVVAAPLCPVDRDWSPELIATLIEEIEAGCAVDPDRVYLTGYSMGGAGTWETAMDDPHLFAAVAPLCGRVIPLMSGRLWRTPVWVFHGEKDSVVPFSQSAEMVEILRGMGNEEVRFTAVPNADHEIWPSVYADPALYQWFLEHRRGDRAR
jgi:predicted peptidase